MANTGQYPENCRASRNQDEKLWTSFQDHFIEAYNSLRETQKTSRQGGYRANNLVGIEEALANLYQVTAKDRVAVTNLNDSNRHISTQVDEQANTMVTKDAAMEKMTKLIKQLQS